MMPNKNQIYYNKSKNIYTRVLGFTDQNEVIVIEIENRKAMGMNFQVSPDYFISLSKIDSDIFEIVVNDKDISPKVKFLRDLRYSIIQPLMEDPRIFDSAWRAKELKLISEKHTNSSLPVLYKYIKLYWIHGGNRNSVLPQFSNCGAKGKEKSFSKGFKELEKGSGTKVFYISDSEKNRIGLGFTKHYINNPQNSLHNAHIAFVASENYAEDMHPSFKQFVYWGHKKTTGQERLKKEGKIKYNKDKRALTGTVYHNIFGPCSEYMFDSTIDNVRGLSSDRCNYIGRFTVYVAIDVYSHLITAIYVTSEPASYMAACGAILFCVTDKKALCDKYGLDFNPADWVDNYLPNKILADRGELLSKMSNVLVESLGISVSNTPSYRPELKSLVEKSFNIFQDRLKGLLVGFGYIEQNKSTRIIRNTVSETCITANDLQKLLLREMVFFNRNQVIKDHPDRHKLVSNNLLPTPINLFNYGVQSGQCCGRISSVDKVWKMCLPRESGSVRRSGIFFQKQFWKTFPDSAVGHDLYYERVKKCSIAFNRNDKNQTFLVMDNSLVQLVPVNDRVSFESSEEWDHLEERLAQLKKAHQKAVLYEEVAKYKMQSKILKQAKSLRPPSINTDNIAINKKAEIQKTIKENNLEFTKGDSQSVPSSNPNAKSKGIKSGFVSKLDKIQDA